MYDDIRYAIEDYCSRYEIDLTEAEMAEAIEEIAERYEDVEEYNYRCGIHSVDLDLIIDSYFSDF